MREKNVVTVPNDGNAQNVAQPKLRSATLICLNALVREITLICKHLLLGKNLFSEIFCTKENSSM